jgi:septal ring-binding cell division protein DamX
MPLMKRNGVRSMRKVAQEMPVTFQCACPRQGKKRRLVLLSACLALFFQGCAAPPPTKTPSETARAAAKTAYLAADYQRTLAIVEPLAIAGEPWAQYTLGYMYHYGRGVVMDKQAAKQWIQRSAEQGYLPARQALQRIAAATPRKTEEDLESPSKPPAPVAKDKEETTVTPAAPGTTTAQPQAQTPATAPIPPPTAATAATPTPAAPAAGAATPPRETTPAVPNQPAAISKPPSPASSTAEEQASRGIKGRDWVAAQDPQHFTIQLLGSSNEDAVIRFIHMQGIDKQAAYYSEIRNGKPWFSVIYGSFPSLDAARQAVQQLPAALRKTAPWLRTFRDIHGQLGP